MVEDAAHAHGATWQGQFAGSFGTAAAFSFYPTKVVTCGEGGMILTGSAALADEARIYRDQGKGSFGANHHVRQGYAWRMSELHAVTGLVHLRRMAASIERRRDSRGPLRRRAGRPGRPGRAGRAARLPQQYLQVHRGPAAGLRPRAVQEGTGRPA